MIIYSELTKKTYATTEACEAAEKEYELLKLKEEEAKKVKQQERETRLAELEEARLAAVEAEKHYRELADAYVKDYSTSPWDIVKVIFR